MSRLKSAFIPLFVIFACIPLAACAARRVRACLPGDPNTQVITVQFVCPNTGASYQTAVVKCLGDKHYQMDFVCQLCGRRHYYGLRYLPYPYRWYDFYFYNGWWYPSPYWRTYWPYGNYPRGYWPYQPGRMHPPPIGPPAARPGDPPQQDHRRNRELRPPSPPQPRYAQPAPPLPRPGPVRVAPVSPRPPADNRDSRGPRSR